MKKPVIIAGAGPVGLCLALLLHKQGIPVRIFEANQEIMALGVGINLLPHSVRVLNQIGLLDELDEIGVRTSALHYYNKHGQKIWEEARGLFADYDYPQFSIHRGKFQLLLNYQVRKRLSAEDIYTGHTLTSWEEKSDGIVVHFKTSDGDDVHVEGEFLAACDGIHSVARKILNPDEPKPIYGGRILWRGVTEAGSFLNGSTMFMAGHQDVKFVAYPISKPNSAGNALLNWIAELAVPDWTAEVQNWNREVSKDKFSKEFKDWNFEWLDIPALIDNAPQTYEFPLSDRDPLDRWREGRVTLVGDAAHPMYPIGSNGASQGILDAEKLVLELTANNDLIEALDAYEAERRPATAKLVLMNRKNGPEQVMQMAEERSPEGFNHIHDILSQQELEEVAARYKQVAGFSLQHVNEVKV